MSNIIEKSRNLSPAEYFEQIQKEYLMAEFRHKIYYSPNDKRYYQRVMNFKKEKIEELSVQNNLKNIFNDKETLNTFKALIFTNGFPIEYLEKDEEMYFTPNNSFSYNGDIYILKDWNRGTSEVKLEKEGKIIWADIQQVRRIL